MRATRWLRALLPLIALAALAGCGGDGDDGTATTTTAGNGGGGGGASITAKVFEKPQAGIPADVGQWMVEIGVDPGGDLAYTVAEATAPPGNTNFQLVNGQPLGHDLTVEEVGGGAVATRVVREGSDWLRISLFSDKEYVFYCSVPGHREAGMEGTVEVDPQLEAKDLKAF